MKDYICSKPRTIMVFLFSLILFIGCREEEDTNCCSEFKILFQYEYVNFAWGISHSGWFLGSDGKVRAYNLPENWKSIDNLGYIASDSLLWNYNQCDSVLLELDLGALAQKNALIEQVMTGELSEIESMGADMGSRSYYAYYWDRRKENYKQLLLSATGDFNQSNTSIAAIKLSEYLKGISDDLQKKE